MLTNSPGLFGVCFGQINIVLPNGQTIDVTLGTQNQISSVNGFERFTYLYTGSASLGTISSVTAIQLDDCPVSKIQINYIVAVRNWGSCSV